MQVRTLTTEYNSDEYIDKVMQSPKRMAGYVTVLRFRELKKWKRRFIVCLYDLQPYLKNLLMLKVVSIDTMKGVYTPSFHWLSAPWQETPMPQGLVCAGGMAESMKNPEHGRFHL